MVHISNDGQVLKAAPWSITNFFSGIMDVIFLFFRTLVPGSLAGDDRPASSSGNGGYGSSNSRPGFPNQRIGRIQNLSSVPIPGGCAGGACGR